MLVIEAQSPIATQRTPPVTPRKKCSLMLSNQITHFKFSWLAFLISKHDSERNIETINGVLPTFYSWLPNLFFIQSWQKLFLNFLFPLGWNSFPQRLHFIWLTSFGSSSLSLLSISALISESSSLSFAAFNKALAWSKLPSPNSLRKALSTLPFPSCEGSMQTKFWG